MAEKKIEEFFSMLDSNEDLRNRLAEAQDENSFLATAVKISTELGYDFSSEELKTHIADTASLAESKLKEINSLEEEVEEFSTRPEIKLAAARTVIRCVRTTRLSCPRLTTTRACATNTPRCL